MKLDARTIGLVIAGTILAIATVWIHYEVKAKLAPTAAAFGSGFGGMTGSDNKYQIGDQIEDFSSTTLIGENISLSDFHDQQVVVLDFWATWCGPCVKGMPGLQQLHDELGERGVEILAVNVGEDIQKVQEFMDREGYTFRVVMDPNNIIKQAFEINGIPQLFVVDKSGNLRHSSVGNPIEDEQLKQKTQDLAHLLEELLLEPSAAASS